MKNIIETMRRQYPVSDATLKELESRCVIFPKSTSSSVKASTANMPISLRKDSSEPTGL